MNHVHCHHVENCSPDDWQTTLGYDRLSLSSYLDYDFCKSLKNTTGIILIQYFIKKNKKKHLLTLIGSLLFRILFMKIIYDNSKILFLCRLLLLIPDGKGSEIAWAEHGLIDVKDLTNVFTCSTTYLEYGEGGNDPLNNWLHCEHHQHGSRHWSLLKNSFIENRELYKIFNGNLFIWNGTTRHEIQKKFVYNDPDIKLYERTRPYRVSKRNASILEKLNLSKQHHMLDKFLRPIWSIISEV
jgi:hypothetical protein